MRTLALGLQLYFLAQGGMSQDSPAGSCGMNPFFVVLTGLEESSMPLLSHCLSSHLLRQLDFVSLVLTPRSCGVYASKLALWPP